MWGLTLKKQAEGKGEQRHAADGLEHCSRFSPNVRSTLAGKWTASDARENTRQEAEDSNDCQKKKQHKNSAQIWFQVGNYVIV